MRVCLYLAIALLVSLTAPLAVHADTGSDGSVDNSEEARQRFHRGVTLFREGAFRAALIEFQRAYELKPHYALLSNIGQTQLELGDYLAASDALRGYLDMGGSEVPPERREKVEGQLASLRERIAVITIAVNLQGADVFIDEQPVGQSPLPRGVAVNVGRHVVRVRTSDGDEDSKVVDVAGGDAQELSFELEHSADGSSVAAAGIPTTELGRPIAAVEKARPRKLYRKIAWGSIIGAGVLAAGTAVGIVLQRREVQAYDKAINTPDVDPNLVAVHHTNAWRQAVAVDVLAALTLVAAGTGLTFWLLGKPSKQDERSALRLGISGNQLLLKGGF